MSREWWEQKIFDLEMENAQLKAELEQAKREFDERDEVAKWYEALVSRKRIGTSSTPSLRSYIEQLEEREARYEKA
jgi:hypothetical protein